jgi:hypothetical protein
VRGRNVHVVTFDRGRYVVVINLHFGGRNGLDSREVSMCSSSLLLG